MFVTQKKWWINLWEFFARIWNVVKISLPYYHFQNRMWFLLAQLLDPYRNTRVIRDRQSLVNILRVFFYLKNMLQTSITDAGPDMHSEAAGDMLQSDCKTLSAAIVSNQNITLVAFKKSLKNCFHLLPQPWLLGYASMMSHTTKLISGAILAIGHGGHETTLWTEQK